MRHAGPAVFSAVPALFDTGEAMKLTWDFPKIRVPYFGVLMLRILLFRVLYQDPLLSETPMKLTCLSS